jgi:hypothetical protein
MILKSIYLKNGILSGIYSLAKILLTMLFFSISFKIIAQGSNETVKDINGNIYRTVTIGTQVRMVENL